MGEKVMVGDVWERLAGVRKHNTYRFLSEPYENVWDVELVGGEGPHKSYVLASDDGALPQEKWKLISRAQPEQAPSWAAEVIKNSLENQEEKAKRPESELRRKAYIEAAEMCPKEFNPVGWRAAVMHYYEYLQVEGGLTQIASAAGVVSLLTLALSNPDPEMSPVTKSVYERAIKPQGPLPRQSNYAKKVWWK